VLALFDGRLAPYKHPRDVVILDAMPRTAVGKPDKKALRAIAGAHCPTSLRTMKAAPAEP
jgi:acyl-CoA synthetase (AMP-forming)/AMP-acid ligase II